MTTDLDEALRTAGADLHFDRPVDVVMARGNRLRRHRRERLGAAAVALVAAGGVVSLVLPSGSSPLPKAEAGWGASMVNLSGDDLAMADAACRSSAIPTDARIVAADTRDGMSALLYRYDQQFGYCSTFAGDDGKPLGTGASTGHEWRPLDAGTYVEDLGAVSEVDLSHTHPGSDDLDGPMRHAVGSARVADEVARLVVRVADQDIEARVGNGLAVYWLPDGILQSAYTAATFTAYAADGSAVDSGLLRARVAR
jgi:hypothetical protein